MENNKTPYDYLTLGIDKSICSMIKNETLLFTDKIVKINRYNMAQERNIMITNLGVYNLKKKTLKRRIDISSIRGITITKSTDEIVLHGNDDEYDYNFISTRRKKIVEYIAKSYFDITKKEMKICELDKKTLKDVVTSKKEKKSDVNYSRMPTTNIISLSVFLYGTIYDDSIRKKSAVVLKSDSIYHKQRINKALSFEDIRILKVIGKSSISKVYMAEVIENGDILALKAIRKDSILYLDILDNIILEKKILITFDHPFLMNMYNSFQTEEAICFLMPFSRGGDMYELIKRFSSLDEDIVLFYAAQIALALDYMHNYAIVYRDLKAENVLLEEDGYLVLTDFGMAKHLKNEKTFTMCGTPEYMSPEVIKGDGYGSARDWWSLGILIYEMLYGYLPFYDQNTDRMFELILYSEVKFGKKTVSNHMKDLIKKLLNKDPNERMGSKNGINEILNHPCFSTIDFPLISHKKLKPPILPEVRSKYDTQYFDEEVIGEDHSFIKISKLNRDFVNKFSYKFKDF